MSLCLVCYYLFPIRGFSPSSKISLLAFNVAAALAAAYGVHAKTFKWAKGKSDLGYRISQNNTLQNGLHANV